MKNIAWLNFLGFDIQAILIIWGILFGIVAAIITIMYISYKRKNY